MENATIRRLVSGALLAIFSSPLAAGLKPGDNAPAFELLDQHSRSHKLSDYRGQWLVLYFYPKDDTLGCKINALPRRYD